MKLKDPIDLIILRYQIHMFILIGPPRIVVDLYACHLVDPFGVSPSLCDNMPQRQRLAGLHEESAFEVWKGKV